MQTPLAVANGQYTTGTPLQVQFERFIQHGRFLRNWSPKTVRSYQQAFSGFQRSQRQDPPGAVSLTPVVLTKAQLEAWIVGLRNRGLSPGGCNVYIRAINSFLSWLSAEELLEKPIHIKALQQTKTVIETFSEAHVRAMLAPYGWAVEQRCVLFYGVVVGSKTALKPDAVEQMIPVSVKPENNKIH